MHSCDSQTALRQNPARVPASLLPGLPGIVVALCLVLAGCNDTPHKAETDEPLPVAKTVGAPRELQVNGV